MVCYGCPVKKEWRYEEEDGLRYTFWTAPVHGHAVCAVITFSQLLDCVFHGFWFFSSVASVRLAVEVHQVPFVLFL